MVNINPMYGKGIMYVMTLSMLYDFMLIFAIFTRWSNWFEMQIFRNESVFSFQNVYGYFERKMTYTVLTLKAPVCAKPLQIALR